MPLRRSAVWIVGRGLVILLISGLAAATLARFAPGFGVDEFALDARLSPESIRALEHQRLGEKNLAVFYVRYLGGLLRGDAGRSVVFGEAVGRLLCERAPLTIHSVLTGVAVGWFVAGLLAAAAALTGNAAAVLAGTAGSGLLVSIPAAVLATLCLVLRLSPAAAIAAVVLPRVYPHVYEQIRASLMAPHVVMARARGISGLRLFMFHIAPPTVMPLVAVGGTSIVLALGAAVPIEALADSPGIGQLAWRAALGRDLPVLVTMTLLFTAVTICASVAADLMVLRLRAGRAA